MGTGCKHGNPGEMSYRMYCGIKKKVESRGKIPSHREGPLTKGQPDLIWELQASVSAAWFQGHIFPESIKRGGTRSGLLPT